MQRLGRLRWVLAALLLAAVGLYLFVARRQLVTQDTWAEVQLRGTIRVGMDASYPPFEWINEEGELVGYDVELARMLGERWGLKVQFANIHFDGLYDALHADKVDLILSALPHDRLLTQDVLYTQSYFNAGQVLVVPESERSIRQLSDLRGGDIAVELGAEAHQFVRGLAAGRADAPEARPFRELGQATEAALGGEAAALICDHVTALGLVSVHPLRIVGEPLTDQPYVMAARLDSPLLVSEINVALETWRRDGTMAALEKRWLR